MEKQLQQLIEENDTELKKQEDLLLEQVNIAYEKAIKKAIKEFKYLEKINDKVKPTSAQVKKILDKTIEAFRHEFETLASPFQKELVAQYENSLKESATVLALRDKLVE
ncbi:hypothetical protein A2Z67_02800 [Candidatus Woesebacteria bacterium RBG_13_36_22]|uniref:Uncharacterized protein n=1 Tax=Candidatus Woesebacteria bacterium RBG_13_36_22 TaxID=1802478 RepID=A0A1F7X661_9BACT|nr:MAG: hypothetical protein A2Z67_02800 [Candidatus Woesebacteria bacterium RBG_13_36_22]